MIRINIFILITFLLSGCATNPLGWGGKNQITLANSKAISIAYDPVVNGGATIYQVAADHCSKFGKEPVPQGTIQRGLFPEATFYCE